MRRRPASAALALALLTAPATAPATLAAANSGTRGTDVAAGADKVTPPHVADVVLIGFEPTATDADRAAARRAAAAVAAESVSPLAADAERWTLPAGHGIDRVIAALSRARGVRYVEPDYLLTTAATSDDPSVLDASLWGMYGNASTPTNTFGSQAMEAWQRDHIGSRSVVVGVIDEGIQITHPDLAANIWVNTAERDGRAGIDDDGNGYVDDVNGWDFYNNDATVYDGGNTGSVDKHGTHVAGTIGGVGGNGVGVAGVNWQVTMISAKFLQGGGSTTAAIRAVDYLTDLKVRHGLNIVATSNSWGGGGFSQSLLDAINRGGDRGILFVAAAGNDASNTDAGANYPSNYQCTTASRAWDCVVSVAAIDANGDLASFSNFGATTVDVAAPGVSIRSSLPPSTYGSYSGTSMATPHVSGAVALCAAAAPTLDAPSRRALLIGSTQPTASVTGKVVTNGRLDVGSLLHRCAGTGADIGAADAPTGLTITALRADLVRLDWTDTVSGETGWEVQRAIADDGNTCGTFTTLATYGDDLTRVWDPGLRAGTTYCYRVRATSSGGAGTVSPWSSTAQVTTPPPPTPYTCSATTYAWLDPTVGGTARALTDDASVNVGLPFTARFYDTDYTSVTVSSNGFLRFGSGAATAFTNVPIPDVAEPNAIAAAWWDDLNPATGGTVYTSSQGVAPDRRFVASWVNINPYGTTGNPVSFQIVLDEATRSITYQYLDASAAAGDRGSSATIGVENPAGEYGTLVSHNSATVNSGSALRCTRPDSGSSLRITTSTPLPVATRTAAYSATFTAADASGTVSWSRTAGTVPTGLSLSSGGVLSGTPSANGTFSFTVTATDTSGRTASESYTVIVAEPVSVTTASPLAAGTVGAGYSQILTAGGGSGAYTWAVTAGALPAGLTLTTSGAIIGTPTTVGTSSVTVTATDSAGRTGSRTYSIQVLTPVVVTSAVPTSPIGAGTAFSHTFAASGGSGTYSWRVSIGSLPNGLNLSSGGVLSGTPTTVGTFAFTVAATDAGGRVGAQSVSIQVVSTALPGAFGKSSPKNGATGVKASTSMSWTASSNVEAYDYCITTTAPTTTTTTCDTGWVRTTSRSVTVTLARSTTYYWQVRAVNANGTTYANAVTGGSTWWRFTTSSR